MWNLSCPDWEQRLREGRTLVPELPLFREPADRAVNVLNKLKLFDVTGTPTMGEAGGEWFRDVVRALFGSYDKEQQQRYIREIFLLVPKKNNKTTGGALLMLTALLLNERPNAPFLLTAPVQKTANDAFNAIAGAIMLDPVLEKKLHIKDSVKTIVHRESKAKLEIMTFDPDIITGKKVVGALIDENHVLGKSAKSNRAMVQLRGGMQPFPEAFLVNITTQSDEEPAGVFKSDLEKARDVRDGKKQAAVLPILYEFPMSIQKDKEKPWLNPELWPMVTPNNGLSIDMERLKTSFEEEKDKSDIDLRIWASQHLNIQIGLSLHANRWAGADYWEAQSRPELMDLAEFLKRVEVVTAGIDGGGLDDLLGLALIGREKGTRRWLLWNHGWAHQIVLQRRKEVASRLLDFENEGTLTIVEQPGQDVEEVADILDQVKDAGLFPEKYAIGVDAAGITDIVNALTSDARGFTLEQITAVPQGYRLNGAIKSAERKLAGGEMDHGGTSFMNWVVGNAKTEMKGNALLITKQASGTAKIDPLMATFNAVTLMGMNPAAMSQEPNIRWI